MVGYGEAMTDPSYFGQILVFTYPLIGNYGVPPLPGASALAEARDRALPRGFESTRVNAASVIITLDSEDAFHWNSLQTLDAWLKAQKVSGIVGLDTRHLVHVIRSTPNLLGRISPERPEGARDYGPLTEAATQGFFDPGAHRIIEQVSTKERRVVGKGKHRIGLIDCGVKWNILRQLTERDCEVELLPWDIDPTKVDCSGWLLSNGPGDPQRTGDLTKRVASLLTGDRPVLGICLGHQILSLAAGAQTKRMQYGHRSHNQPVYLVGTRRGFITSQNHGYVVDEATLPKDWEPWFRNVNDQTNEGIRHKTKPFQSVQFHPEAAGGPRDTGWILQQFVDQVGAYNLGGKR
jgi:carbamoyl-phosphate synthase small subunit